MSRREFIAILGGLGIAWPRVLRAQQPDRMRRIGVLWGAADDLETKARNAAFFRNLSAVGWTDGKNVRLDYRFGGGDAGKLHAQAKELVALTPDVILISGSLALSIVRQETSSAPIVFAQVSDPIRAGFVESLSKPGGNITGFTVFEYSIAEKWLELLKEAAPHIERVILLLNFQSPIATGLPAMKPLAESLKVRVTTVSVSDVIDKPNNSFAGTTNTGLIVVPDASVTVNRERIVARAASHGLPAIYPYRYFATSGGLMSYGPDLLDVYGRSNPQRHQPRRLAYSATHQVRVRHQPEDG